jgi:hypothetical protein
MRIVVGTLHSGENEFAECCAALAEQSLQPVDHFVISNLPKREAHAKLHREFEARANDCDLFIKLDADMVIIDNNLFAGIAKRFSTDPELDHLKIALKDFFSNRLIGALNCYRSSCRWANIHDAFQTDAAPVNRRKREVDWTTLAPAALHCKNPSGFQSFHYGLQKGLKARAAANRQSVPVLLKHFLNIELTWRHFVNTGDQRLLLASAGAELALSQRLLPADMDYDSASSRQAFKLCEAMSVRSLNRRVRWLRFWNRRGLPVALRGRQLALGWKSLIAFPRRGMSVPEAQFTRTLKERR